MVKIDPTSNFCILPWIHLYAEPNGKVYLEVHLIENITTINIQSTTI